MEGTQIVQAWREWLESEEGCTASDPYPLGADSGARQYLENRLQRAFQAGINAAETVKRIHNARSNHTS